MAGILAGLLGSFPSASGPYELISTTLISTNTSTVTFSSIPTDYSHLQIRWTARSNRADYQDTMAIRLNGVTTSTYTTHNLKGNGSVVSSAVNTAGANINQSQLFDMFSTNEATGAFGAGIVDILDIGNTNKKPVVKMLSGLAGGTQSKFISITSGFTTSGFGPLSSVTLLSRNSASFVSGSRFSLYGIKGA